MNRKLTLAIIVNLLLSFSGYLLILLITRSEQENDLTTKLRLSFLLGVHALAFLWMIAFIKIQQLFNIILSVFTCLFLTALSLYICELKVQSITFSKLYHYDHYAYHLEKLELSYLNIYFLIYMYSLIGLIPTGLYLITTEGLMCWQQYLINKYKDKCLKKIAYKQSLKHQTCSICLGQFEDQSTDDLIQINNCGHIFHEKCLCQWLRYQTKCPMDRGQIFVFRQEEDEQ